VVKTIDNDNIIYVCVFLFAPFLIPVEYIKLSKAKQKPIKYLSPYLEPLPKTEIPWAKMKEIKRHNVNVKKQRIRENAKAKKKQELNEMAVNYNSCVFK